MAMLEEFNSDVGIARTQHAILEKKTARQELAMRGEIDEWAEEAVELFQATTESVTQWCIHEPTDRVLYTDAYLKDEGTSKFWEKLCNGTLSASELPYARELGDLEGMVRLAEDARTRAVIYWTEAGGIRGALIRRFTDGILYVWTARIPDSKFEDISMRASLINEEMERHEADEEQERTRYQARSDAAVELAALCELLASRMKEEGFMTEEEESDALVIVDRFISEMKR